MSILGKKKINLALQKVRDVVSQEGSKLDPTEYRSFLEELMADAEGWKMQLEEMEDE